MNWNDSKDFEEVFLEIKKQLYKDDFFELMKVENVEKFLEYLRDELSNSNDDELLSDVLMRVFRTYEEWEVGAALDELSEKGLVQMVLREDGKLAYQATEDGIQINDFIHSMLNHVGVRAEQKSHKIMDIKYSEDVYKVIDLTDGMRLVDHGNNYEFMIIPAGKQHDGEEFVEFYHTIFTHYNDPGPNGQYELVDEVQLYDMLNKNYNQY
jgi:ABC-type transport system substrate-binding protein